MTETEALAQPKVFISHSSADKGRFVLDFATRLRKDGVDAWVDCWEMGPGDCLVDKIWNEALKGSNSVIVVLSKFSIESKWVREELNTAFVKKLNGQIRLIPVRLDECVVPECLLATLWKDIPDLQSYERQYGEIVDALFGRTAKPPLGTPPPYVREAPLDGLERIDTLVLEKACEAEIATGLWAFEKSFLPLLSEGVTEDQIIESQEVLQRRGLVKLHYAGGRHPQTMEVLPLGFDLYANKRIPGFQALVAEIGRRIVREEQMANRTLADALNQPLRVVSHALAVLESKGWIETGDAYGCGYHHIDVSQVSPELKRWLEKL